ncbi:MAG: sulfurtransferase TusA family protein [Desulfobulbus sp.]|jgi:tRNA 2-thiouridine synthesizing protein A
MTTTVDARGLSCPQPVLMTLAVLQQGVEGAVTVLVDTETSKENVGRAAASQGWRVSEVEERDGGYRMVLTRA